MNAGFQFVFPVLVIRTLPLNVSNEYFVSIALISPLYVLLSSQFQLLYLTNSRRSSLSFFQEKCVMSLILLVLSLLLVRYFTQFSFISWITVTQKFIDFLWEFNSIRLIKLKRWKLIFVSSSISFLLFLLFFLLAFFGFVPPMVAVIGCLITTGIRLIYFSKNLLLKLNKIKIISTEFYSVLFFSFPTFLASLLPNLPRYYFEYVKNAAYVVQTSVIIAIASGFSILTQSFFQSNINSLKIVKTQIPFYSIVAFLFILCGYLFGNNLIHLIFGEKIFFRSLESFFLCIYILLSFPIFHFNLIYLRLNMFRIYSLVILFCVFLFLLFVFLCKSYVDPLFVITLLCFMGVLQIIFGFIFTEIFRGKYKNEI